MSRIARLAGLLYVVTNATAIFAFVIRGRVLGRGDIAQSQSLFRLAIASELLTIAGVLMLLATLYVLLKPFGHGIALAGLLWRLAENLTLAIVVIAEFAMLRFADAPKAIRTLLGVYGDGFRIGFFFLGLGSMAFAFLWLKSRYMPPALAWIGIGGSIVMAAAELGIIIAPPLASVLQMAYMAPMGVFEIFGGFWLMLRGIRT